MRKFLHILCEHLEQGIPLALATVVQQQGSAPRGAGSRLLAGAAGLVTGTVGGGLVEARTLDMCRQTLADGKSRVLECDLSGELAASAEMICGGHVRVLVEALPPAAAELFRQLERSLDGDGAVLVSRVSALPSSATCSLRHSLLLEDRVYGAELPQPVLDAARTAWAQAPAPGKQNGGTLLRTGPTERAGQTEQGEFFVDVWLPPRRLVLAGGGHVSRPTVEVAALAGFEVTVLDDRAEFSDARRFPKAAHVRTVPDFADCFAHTRPGPRDCVVIVTRGHVHDASVLWQALHTRAGYVGMIGSRRKREEVYAQLRGQGVDDSALARVHCPVGLPIGAETPEEIAVSIVAECIAACRGK